MKVITLLLAELFPIISHRPRTILTLHSASLNNSSSKAPSPRSQTLCGWVEASIRSEANISTTCLGAKLITAVVGVAATCRHVVAAHSRDINTVATIVPRRADVAMAIAIATAFTLDSF
ncbi:uncharacterized protein PAC_06833 [Phialocephala subalpina]|uniref:Uncharacterized protein n=1 Tax=Phialocephala subalpina TaxID=576137 RepID=A0A1L7WW06_9HELO|nr:uncharacterized protein PAC_06833 [Phialocephala subalpina]